MSLSVHTIALKGPAGIAFSLLLLAAVFFVLGFGSNGWAKAGRYHIGLWQTCYDVRDTPDASYFVATQVFMSVGLAGLTVAVVLVFLYMCVTPISKNIILLSLTITCFVSALAMLIGLIVFGVESENSPDWSFGMVVIGMILTLGAGSASSVQLHKSHVPCMCCRR